MAALREDVKAFIVQALACFDTPTQVATAVKEEFGIDIDRSHVQAYDPNKALGRNLGKKWRELFAATRKAFLDDQATIPIASQNFRLRALDRMYQQALARGNLPLASQLIEQAAKEAGGAFTNRQKLEHTGKDGGPIKTAAGPVDLSDLTDDELDVLERLSARRDSAANQG